jgi:hypothetical protein
VREDYADWAGEEVKYDYFKGRKHEISINGHIIVDKEK